jgi:ferredoxin
VEACHEGAIEIVNNKAKLIKEDYCDGLGNCLPVCPVGAIHFEEQEALEYNGLAVTSDNTFSELRQWPVQIKLVAINAPYFDNANLLIAADCAAYASGEFHHRFMKDTITLIGCPKLDNTDYSEKLTEIILKNNIKSVVVVRMEVPCCGGIEQAVISALEKSGKSLPWKVSTLSINGKLLEV